MKWSKQLHFISGPWSTFWLGFAHLIPHRIQTGSAVFSTHKSHASNISGTPIWVPHSVLSRLWVFWWGERRNAQGFQLWCRVMDSQTSETKISWVCSKRYYMCHVLVLQNLWNSVHPSIPKKKSTHFNMLRHMMCNWSLTKHINIKSGRNYWHWHGMKINI